ncbi:MAG: hypothetical protein ABII13_04390 [Patescibacteria group bacterium]|nr:YtxH domain-containing protein [Patescibacteria group bacterium]
MSDKKKKSHLGAGMVIGAAIGAAAAAFMQTKKGKELKDDLTKKTLALQKKINAELKKKGAVTKAGYEDLVDKVTAYYVVSKNITKTEVPAVKKTLMTHWKKIEAGLKSVDKKPVAKKKPAAKKKSPAKKKIVKK